MLNFKIFLVSLTYLVPMLLSSKAAGESENLSYALGYLFGKNIYESGVELEFEELSLGMQDALADKKGRFDSAELADLITEYNNQVALVQKSKNETAINMNKKLAQDFLKQNAAKSSVQETASGLQYEVLSNEEGPKPSASDTVTVHYRGTLLNGAEFDSSYSRGEPATFPLNRVIKGWTEGLQLMSVGEKYRFFIPPELAYGEFAPPGSQIEPNSLLIFEVELIKIN